MKARILIAGLCLCLTAAQASAVVSVTFDAQDTVAPFVAGGSVLVDIVADIPMDDATLGWGLDVGYTGTDFSGPAVTVGGLWAAFGGVDGDGLSALSATLDPVWGDDIVLATLDFTMVSAGYTDLSLGVTPGDLTEGFALEGIGEFADLSLGMGSITTPEPASLALLALGGLMLIRRR